MNRLLFVFAFCISIQSTKAQISYTWNGSVSTAANVAANWTPNGIPGALDDVTIVAAGNICILPVNATVSNFTITSGTLNLGGHTATVTGNIALFSSGTVQNGTITVSGANTTTFGNGTVNMNCAVNITSATVTFRNTTFQQTVSITKKGSSNDRSVGNNTFNGPTTITNAGTGYLMLADTSPDQFNKYSYIQ